VSARAPVALLFHSKHVDTARAQDVLRRAVAHTTIVPHLVDIDAADSELVDAFAINLLPTCVFICESKWYFIVHDISAEALCTTCAWVTDRITKSAQSSLDTTSSGTATSSLCACVLQ
jgi:hypothetical protein